MPSQHTQNAIATWDFTLSCAHAPIFDELVHHLNEWCKKWVFQRERGDPTEENPEGFLHYQGRVSLIKKRRKGELLNKEFLFKKAHLSPTSSGVHQAGSFSYVLKADSRVDGPWSDAEYVPPPPVTRQLRAFRLRAMYPWQTEVCRLARESCDRRIIVIKDSDGNSGKSILAEHLEQLGEVCDIPPFQCIEDIMQCVMGLPTAKCYMIDMPRGMRKDKLAGFFAGLECVKNGKAYDKRYGFKQKRFDRPMVIVFTNNWPDWSLVSIDRWAPYDLVDRVLIPLRVSNVGGQGYVVEDVVG